MLFTTASKHFIGTLEEAHNRCVRRVAGAGMWASPGACLQVNGWAPSPVSLQSPAFPTDPHKSLQTQIQESPLDHKSYPKIPWKAVERKGKKNSNAFVLKQTFGAELWAAPGWDLQACSCKVLLEAPLTLQRLGMPRHGDILQAAAHDATARAEPWVPDLHPRARNEAPRVTRGWGTSSELKSWTADH